MCEFHDSNCNGFGDMWWTDKCIYFSSRGLYNFVVANVTLHVKHTVNMLCMILLLFLCIYYYVCGCNISQKVEGHDRLRLQQTRQLMMMMIIIIGN